MRMKNRISSDASADSEADLLWINPPVRMVRHEVVERLREAIRLCRFKPGQRLIERELCEWTGVSRTSIREALRQLESEGLVEIIPRRGPAVAVISPEEVMDIYDVRMSVEPRMVERFIDIASNKDVEDLTKTADQLTRATAAEDQAAVSRAKGRYFAILMDGCQNQTLAEVVRSLHVRLILAKSAYLQEPARWTKSAEELTALAKAIGARDPEKAVELCRKHLELAAAAASVRAEGSQHLRQRKVPGISSDAAGSIHGLRISN